jgi:quercetin dioxygenase-like cupin family protein
MSDTGKDPTTGRNPAGELLAFALDHEVARAKGEPQWTSHDRFAQSLAKHRDLTVNVMLLRKGAHLQEHQARGSITLQVLSGAIRFIAHGQEKTLTTGMLAVLDKEVPHSVQAIDESALLLTAALP